MFLIIPNYLSNVSKIIASYVGAVLKLTIDEKIKLVWKLDKLRSSCGVIIIRILIFFQINYGLLIIFQVRIYDKKCFDRLTKVDKFVALSKKH